MITNKTKRTILTKKIIMIVKVNLTLKSYYEINLRLRYIKTTTIIIYQPFFFPYVSIVENVNKNLVDIMNNKFQIIICKSNFYNIPFF